MKPNYLFEAWSFLPIKFDIGFTLRIVFHREARTHTLTAPLFFSMVLPHNTKTELCDHNYLYLRTHTLTVPLFFSKAPPNNTKTELYDHILILSNSILGLNKSKYFCLPLSEALRIILLIFVCFYFRQPRAGKRGRSFVCLGQI